MVDSQSPNNLLRESIGFPIVLTCIQYQVDWSLVIMHQSHTSKTLKYVADNLHAFHAMKDIFTTSQTFKATDIITIACRKNLEMQLKFKHAMEDEEKPSCSEDQSGSPMDE